MQNFVDIHAGRLRILGEIAAQVGEGNLLPLPVLERCQVLAGNSCLPDYIVERDLIVLTGAAEFVSKSGNERTLCGVSHGSGK